MADLAAARRELRDALCSVPSWQKLLVESCGVCEGNPNCAGDHEPCGCHETLRVIEAALALLAASPEPAPALPEEVWEAAERLALLRMVAAEGCRDKPGSGVTCREAGVPPDEVCEVCRVIKYLSAQGGGR